MNTNVSQQPVSLSGQQVIHPATQAKESKRVPSDLNLSPVPAQRPRLEAAAKAAGEIIVDESRSAAPVDTSNPLTLFAAASGHVARLTDEGVQVKKEHIAGTSGVTPSPRR